MVSPLIKVNLSIFKGDEIDTNNYKVGSKPLCPKYMYIQDIIEAIHELSPNSAAGPDCVPSSLLTNCAPELAPVLLLIFSHSLSNGVIPDSWKRAAVIPIYKSGDKTVPSNYRPISLTSVKS